MRYMGSKQKIAKKLVEAMAPDLAAAKTYVEPFMGGLGMAPVVAKVFDGPMVLSDTNPALSALFSKWADSSWSPPDRVTRDDYDRVKRAQDPTDPLTALLGFGMSYGGKWFAGFIGESKSRDYWAELKRAVDRKTAPFVGRANVSWGVGSYEDVLVQPGAVVYCDPPYAGTTTYAAAGDFNHGKFWAWVRETSKTAVVYVSEYRGPCDVPVVWEGEKRMTMDDNKRTATEKLFRLGPEDHGTKMQHPTSTTVAIDTETYLLRPGLLAPRLVCLAWADTDGNLELLGREDSIAWFRENITRPDISWVLHNGAFDMTVLMNEAPETTPWVFRAYLENRVHDTMLREALIRIAKGTYSKGGFIPLSDLTKSYLSRDRSAQKKGPDVWRTRYAELESIPVDQWPDAAREYALDDAADTLRVCTAQAMRPVNAWASGSLSNQVLPDGGIVNEADQCRAALALHLMSCYGLHVDQEAAHALQEEYKAEADRLHLQLVQRGLKDANGKTNTKKVVSLIMDALTADATDQDREAVFQAVQDAERNFHASEAALVEAEKKKKAGNWTPTREHIATVAAWVARGFEIPTTKGGKVKTGEEILETVPDPDIELLVQWSGADKRLSTYLEPMTSAGDNALCPSYNVLMRSGRTSSSGPNIQNFPRKGGERECFVPREGFLLVAADYSTLELRSWAQVCLDLGLPSEMARALQAGRDLHADLGAQLAGVTYETFEGWLEGSAGPEKKKYAKTLRSAAKPANFGLPVGMGAAKFEESARKSYGVNFEDLGVTAEEVREAWYERWTEAHPYFNHVKGLLKVVGQEEEVLEDGSIEYRDIRKCDIRHPRSGRVRGGCFFTDAANSYFQGMAADGAKEALFRVALECYADPSSPLFGCRPVAFIHDEILLEAPKSRVQAAADRLSRVMIEAMEVYIPDIPIVCEADIMDRWAKGAESKRLEDGTLSVYWTDVERLRAQAREEEDRAKKDDAWLHEGAAMEARKEAARLRARADELEATLNREVN